MLLLLVFAALIFSRREFFIHDAEKQHQDSSALNVPKDPAQLPNAESNPKKLFPNQSENDIKLLSISELKAKVKFAFRKERDSWMMVSPVHFPAANTIVRGWIGALSLAERNRGFPVSPEADLREFGLSDPDLEVCLSSAFAEEEQCLEIGKRSPFQEALYARLKGESEVFLVDARLKMMFMGQSVYGLLQTNLFPLALQDATEVAVRRSGKEILFTKDVSGWSQIKPVSRSVDLGTMRELLQILNQLHLREFLDGANSQDPTLGLTGGGLAQIAVRYESGRTELMLLGKELSERSAYYGRLELWPNIFLVSKERTEAAFTFAESLGKSIVGVPSE